MRVKKRVALYGAALGVSGLVASQNIAEAGVWQDGRDLKKEEYTGENTAVTLLYKVVRDPVLGNYTNLGTGTFISPNVILTVGHNYMEYESAQPNYKNKLTPNTTFYYNLGTTNMDARQTYIPSDGVSTRLGTTQNLSARFKHVDMNKFSTRNSDEINWQYDFNLVVTDTPMQFTSPNKQAEPLDLIDRSAEDAARRGGYDIHYSGYMVDFEQSSGTNLVKNPNVTPGNLLSVRTKTNYSQNVRKGINGSIVTWNNTSGGGFSGSTLRNNQGKVIGVLNGGYNGKNGENMGLVFNNKTLNWIRQVIKENQIKGWREHNGQRYYFQDNGHLYRNTTQVIDGVKWQFDENGVATHAIAKGTLKVKVVDNEGHTLIEKLILDNQNEGTDYQFDPNQESIIQSLLATNQLKENKNAKISGKLTAGEKTITITYEHVQAPTEPVKPKQMKPVEPTSPIAPTEPMKPTHQNTGEPEPPIQPVAPVKPTEPTVVSKTNTPSPTKPTTPQKPIAPAPIIKTQPTEPVAPKLIDKNEPIKPKDIKNPITKPIEQPKVEKPKVEKPIAKPIEQPKVEQPKVEQPKVEKPKVEQPKVEQPKVEKPLAKPIAQPKVEKPVAKPIEQPKVEKPIAKPIEQPKVEKPIAKPIEQPKVEKPVVKPIEQPKVEKPVTKPIEQPNVGKPIAKPIEQPKPVRKPVEQPLYIRRRKHTSSGQVSHRYYLRPRHQYLKHRLSIRQTRKPYESKKQYFNLATALHRLIDDRY